MKVFGKKIVVEEQKVEKIGDLIVPETNRQENRQGIVKLIGDEIEPAFIKEDDIVVYPHFAGTKFVWNEVEYTVLKMDEIIIKL